MLNIAICDDMLLPREAIENHIKKYKSQKENQFNIVHFQSGEEFIDKFDENKTCFDLISLDYKMSELNGFDTAVYIRMNNTVCNIVFVLSKNEKHLEFQKVKPLRILHKPITKKEIDSIFDEIL